MQVSISGEVPQDKLVFANIANWCVISGPRHWPVANGDLTFHIAGTSFTPEIRFSLGRIKAGMVATGVLLALFLSAHVLVAPALAEPIDAAGYAVESISFGAAVVSDVESALLGVFEPQMAPDAPGTIAVTAESPTPEAGAPTEIPAPTETTSPTATTLPSTVAKSTSIPVPSATRTKPVAAPILKPTPTIVPTIAPPAAPGTTGTNEPPKESPGQGKEPPGQSKEPPGQEKNGQKPNPPSPPGQAKEPPGQGKK